MATKSGITVKEIKTDRLFGLLCHLAPAEGWSDDYLERKIREAEDGFEREMGLLLRTQRIKCEPKPDDTDWDIEESAYDYDADFFAGERWGYLRLRRYPVQSVQRLFFSYPNREAVVFEVPLSWVRLEKPYGLIRLVPDKQAAFAAFNSYLLSIFSGGRGIPQSIVVEYTAGLTEKQLQADFSDVLEWIKRQAVVNIAADGLMPGSLSNSADGFSQSISAKLSDYREDQEKQFKAMKQKIKGVRLAIV